MLTQRALHRLFGVLAVVVTLGLPSVSQASLIVSFAPSNPNPIQAGGTGYVDVLVRSTSSDRVNAYLLDFDLLLTPAPLTGLNFAATQDNSYISDALYVFNSAGVTPASTEPSTSNVVFNTGNLANFLDVGEYVVIGDTDLLLGRFSFTADPGTAGTFTIGLASVGGSFLDENFNEVLFDVTPGSIEVSAVPEPTTLSLALCGLGVAGLFYRRKSQRTAA